MVAKIIREPMFHFVIMGALIFAVDTLMPERSTGRGSRPEQIVITQGRADQLAEIFSRTWQRAPTSAELEGLIEAWVKEEVYYREAVKLGLDHDDTLVRRRMQQKMEFLTEPGQGALIPTEAQLDAWLAKHRTRYRKPPEFAFSQVFISSQNAEAESRAGRLLERLSGPSGTDPQSLGDPTMLPKQMPLTPLPAIARLFGNEFAENLTGLSPGRWTGPVASAYGIHLVEITAKEDATDPPLAAVRDKVLRDWRQARREAHMKSEYERLRERYEIVRSFEPEGAAGQ